MKQLIDFILHIDEHLLNLANAYWNQLYLILFAIIFIETGLVIMPFLPWDSLLFAAWALAGMWKLNLIILLLIAFIAAVLGDTTNYFIWKYFSKYFLKLKIFWKNLVKQEDLNKTHQFFEKHGPKTIIIARFVPIVRTLAPFVAWTWNMNYSKFLTYNIVWGFIWTFGLILLGYFFWNLEPVKKNFEIVIFAIIGISILPMIYEYFQHKKFKGHINDQNLQRDLSPDWEKMIIEKK